MKHLAPTMLLLAGLAAPVLAQAPDPNTQAILEALKGLNTRLDGMQKDIDGLKSGAAKAPAPPSAAPATQAPAASAPTPPPSAPRASGQLRPGWVVSAYAKKEDANGNFDSDPIGVFVWPRNNFNKNIHNQSFGSSNSLSYKADAFFRASEGGRHIFAAKADFSGNGNARCKISLSVDGKSVFDSNFGEWNSSSVLQGGVDLIPGDYKIQVIHVCNQICCYGTNSESEKNTNFLIQTRSPEDMILRNFNSNEIVHIAKGGQRSSVDSPAAPVRAASPAADPTPPAPGAVRLVKSEVNVRQQPSTAAPVVATLDPGNRLRIAALSNDQQWAQVEINGRPIGFIRVTALNLNTQ